MKKREEGEEGSKVRSDCHDRDEALYSLRIVVGFSHRWELSFISTASRAVCARGKGYQQEVAS